ncbi:hypothetical protein ACA910_013472 [Epithemia clementina (nom. ined.)]
MVAELPVDRMEVDETTTGENGDDNDEEDRSLRIPITSSSSNSTEPLYVEIFPEEMSGIPATKLLQVLKDEKANFSIWADAGLLYMQQKHARQALAVLEEACDLTTITEKSDILHSLAATGIAHLAASNLATGSGGISSNKSSKRNDDPKSELRQRADEKFTKASKIDTFFPMTWIGRGMLLLEKNQFDQARFFFQTTEKQCGLVLPALLGMAAVLFAEKDFKGAQAKYSVAIRQYPEKSGAPARVGLGLSCYKLGQIDRAKAAFKRALEIDPENVEAMVSTAVLDMASLDHTSPKELASQTEKAIKLMSMANLLDSSNAMVQNHLANHYFWKWTQEMNGTVSVTQGSNIISTQYLSLEPGERIRIGTQFETTVVDEVETEDDGNENEVNKYKIHDIWTNESGSLLKVWKKDYDRVITLAKGAYSSTSVDAMRAESLFFLARVYHVREDFDNAHKFYKQACKLSADSGGDDAALTPARFGLAQTLIVQKKYDDAAAQLKLILQISAQATDALALLGLLLVRNPKTLQEGIVQLQKAIELDPLNPNWVILEALALQQHEANYPKALERYKKAIQLLKAKHLTTKSKSKRRQQQQQPQLADAAVIPYDIYANCGVLCHKTNHYEESLQMYGRALEALVATTSNSQAYGTVTLDDKGIQGGRIRHNDNNMFFEYVNTNLPVAQNIVKPTNNEDETDAVNEEESSRRRRWKIQSQVDDIANLAVEVGDHVRCGKDFESEITSIEADGEGVTVELKDEFVYSDESKDYSDETDTGAQQVELEMWVKRENKILEIPKALTIVFNIARLHEAAGRTLAAIELHKAILKRNPAYVNSLLCLACIAVDCGALQESSKWLKLAAQTAPGNPEVLTLVGNLHLSLADWQPAQKVFDTLLVKKVANVEAYASLSLGNIYFATLHLNDKRYARHLQYASDYYKRILTKDPANAYAGNGLGTVLAEKAEIFKAKEVFNRVREVSGDTIADTLVNLGHIYLAQKKHPEALQMYKSYMKRAEDGTTPITSKSRVDDVVDVLMYIAFAYFDWARHTELSNDANAAPADGRYLEAMNYLKLAISKNSKRDIVLKYNLCMTKLQAANCILQKLTRNIPRTVEEVQGALDGLNESFEVVQAILKEKSEGAKVQISTSKLQDFLKHCKANISSAESHLDDEKKRAEEAETEREIRRLAAEAALKEEEIKKALANEKVVREQEERDRKAEAKMKKVEELQVGWKQEQAREAEKKAAAKKKSGPIDDFIVQDNGEDGNDEEEEDGGGGGDDEGKRGDKLFDASDDENDNENDAQKSKAAARKKALEARSKKASKHVEEKDIFGDSDEDGGDDDNGAENKDDDEEGKDKDSQPVSSAKNADLFGESSENDESDEELVAPSKRAADEEEGGDGQPAKKRRVLEEDE